MRNIDVRIIFSWIRCCSSERTLIAFELIFTIILSRSGGLVDRLFEFRFDVKAQFGNRAIGLLLDLLDK